jgi:hypothetical protein
MIRRPDGRPFDRTLRRRFSSGGLKVCPICGTLSTQEVYECFVCWWHGDFEDDPSYVEYKIAELVQRSPELAGLLEEPQPPVNRFRLAVRRVLSNWRSRIDVRA